MLQQTTVPHATPYFVDFTRRWSGVTGLVADDRPGDWAQALMDLGATLCRPRQPLCDRCPIAEDCLARDQGAPETYPRKTAKAERPHRRGIAYVLTQGDVVGLVRRPDK